ncbi:hypothetical protein I4U23_019649 [Adineta vaga]|nr:hypothetical protein I4U23_019649 [Adineta vaga]
MNTQQTMVEASTDHMICPFGTNHCKEPFPKNEWASHCESQAHLISFITFLCHQRVQHESASNELDILSQIVDETEARENNSTTINYPACMEQLTFHAINIFKLNNSEDGILNNSINESSPFNLEQLLQVLIERSDREKNYTTNLQLLGFEEQLNQRQMSEIASFMLPSSDIDETPPTTEVQHSVPLQSTEHEATLSDFNLSDFLRIQQAEESVSAEMFIWKIEDVRQKIDDAICRRKIYIDSPKFQTPLNGHKVWVRLYLNGNAKSKYLSIKLHLNFPIHNPFSAGIKFILVDQGTQPLQHIIKSCDASGSDVNASFGFDEFIDKNFLHINDNSYVLDNSICFVIHINQTQEQKLAHLDANTRDAIIQSSQT